MAGHDVKLLSFATVSVVRGSIVTLNGTALGGLKMPRLAASGSSTSVKFGEYFVTQSSRSACVDGDPVATPSINAWMKTTLEAASVSGVPPAIARHCVSAMQGPHHPALVMMWIKRNLVPVGS